MSTIFLTLLFTTKWNQCSNKFDFESSLLIPPTIQLNLTETYKLAEKQTNLAMQYWKRWSTSNWQNDLLYKFGLKYCEQIILEDPLMLNHNNIYWQKTIAKNMETNETIDMYLYNAYYDIRPSSGPVVVLLTVNKMGKLARFIKWS